MPYKIQKKGSQWCVVRKDTGASKGCSSSHGEAVKHMAALYANEPKAAANPSAADKEEATLATRHLALSLRTAAEGYQARKEVFDGRPHLAVPVTMLVEGVVHAINAESPELVLAEQFGKQPNGWNGRPLYHGHPFRNGKPVSGNLPEVLMKDKIGTVFNAKLKDNSLRSEAWIDEQFCRERAPELLDRVMAGEPIEISVGAFVDTDEEEGDYEGRNYKAVWKDIIPDHLALLPAGDEGACSMEMGCGIRTNANRAAGTGANQYTNQSSVNAHNKSAEATKASSKAARVNTPEAHQAAQAAHQMAADAHSAVAYSAKAAYKPTVASIHEQQAQNHTSMAQMHASASRNPRAASKSEDTVDHMYAAWLEDDTPIGFLKTLRNISQEHRDKMPKENFAGPNESFPIEEAGDVENASRAIGRAKGNRGAIKSKIISIAYRMGFEDHLPEDWKKKKDQKNAKGFAAMMQQVRDLFRVSQSAEEMSDKDLRCKLEDALKEVEDCLLGVEAFTPVSDPSHVIYRVYDPDDSYDKSTYYGPMATCLYERSFELDAETGVVTLGDTRVEVTPVTSYEPAEGAKGEKDDMRDMANGASTDLSKSIGAAATKAQKAADKASGAAAKGKSNVAQVSHAEASQEHQNAANYAKQAGQGAVETAHKNAADAHAQAAQMHATGAQSEANAASQTAAEATGKATNLKLASSASGVPSSDSKKTPCGCGPKAAEKKQMAKTREARIAKLLDCSRNPIKDKSILESLSDEQLKTLRKYTKGLKFAGVKESQFKACATKKEAEGVISKMAEAHNALHGYAAQLAAKNAKDSVPPAGQDDTAKGGSNQKVDQSKSSGDPKDAQAKAPTFAELLALADADTQTAIKAGADAAKARKSAAIASIKANSRNKFSDEQLTSMSIEQLDNLVALSGHDVRDYSGAGAVRPDAKGEAVAAPADLGEAIRAARAKK